MDLSETDNKTSQIFGVRHLQVVMLFFATMVGLSMRVNMSIAIVEMTNSNNDNYFDWNIQTQSLILSSFFWGYIILQIPGGEMNVRFGGKLLISICIAGNSIASVLIPLAAYTGGWQMVCACRVIQGLFQGFLVPSTHHLMGKWVPLKEKNRLVMLVYSGAYFGIAIQLLAAGFLADNWGWPSIFYANGAFGAVWTVIYIFIGSDTPRESKIISNNEKMYIEKSLGVVKEKKIFKTPWGSIWTSPAFLSVIVAHIGHAWGMWTMMTEIPSYISQVLGVNIKDNGLLSSMPYFIMFILSFPFGFISDYALKRKWLSINVCRKINNSISFLGPAAALITLSYVPPNITVAVILLCITVGLNSGHITGFFMAHIDMAPNFAGTLMGITNGIANFVAIFAPLAAGAILKDESDQSQWRKVFFLSSGLYIAGNMIYVIFGTSERQQWNEPDKSGDTNDATCSNKCDQTV